MPCWAGSGVLYNAPMDRTFEQIAKPFQTGNVDLPRGVNIQVGIIAHTPPQELENAILNLVGDNVLEGLLADPDEGRPLEAFEATHSLAHSVDKEITRLSRRRHIANCVAGTLLGIALGMGAYKGLEAVATKGIEAVIDTPQKESTAKHPDNFIVENDLGVAGSIGGITGGVYGWVVGSRNATRNAQRNAQRIINHNAVK